jgi:hypothetical protein
MKRTPNDTPVGVDDPYDHVERCDHLTDDGRCRFAFDHPERDPGFARERREDGYRCPVVSEGASAGEVSRSSEPKRDPDGWDWADCPHFRSRTDGRECVRCGLEERRMAHTSDRPLLEEHHLSYSGDETTGHEITVILCRWCHAKVHGSWARIDDDAAPDSEALAEREGRRDRELDEVGFESAADRYDR